jgi:hypothetical protein
VVQALGYNAATATSTNPHGDAVFSKNYSAAGTLIPGSGPELAPGDCAALLRYGTTARSSRNHPVYLFNYYHGVYQSTTNNDSVLASQVTAIEAYGTDWLTGFTADGTPRERCGPRGAVSVTRRCDPYIRHRDFPA